jgi:hypothetical protein
MPTDGNTLMNELLAIGNEDDGYVADVDTDDDDDTYVPDTNAHVDTDTDTDTETSTDETGTETETDQSSDTSTVETSVTTDAPKPYTLEDIVAHYKAETPGIIDNARIPAELQNVNASLLEMAKRTNEANQFLIKQQQERNANLPVDELMFRDPNAAFAKLHEEMINVNTAIKDAQTANDIFQVSDLLIKKEELKEQFETCQR